MLRYRSTGEHHRDPQIYQVGAKLISSKNELSKRDLKLHPRFDKSNRIVGCWLKVGIEEESVFYPLNIPDEENTVVKSDFTNQSYTIFTSERNNPSMLLVETQLTSHIELGDVDFSAREKQYILRQQANLILDTVDSQWPQDLKSKMRMFSNYEALDGRKPYELTKLTPSQFEAEHEDRFNDNGHRILIDLIFDKDSP